MKKLILGSIIFLFSTCLFAQTDKGKIHTKSMSSKILGVDREYSIYLPANYESSDKSYPVLYLLHGRGDNNENGWPKKGDGEYIINKTINEGFSAEMIIVMPDAGRDVTGYFNVPNWAFEDYFFDELIPYIEKTYRAKTTKEYRSVAGLSMGGGGSIVYALHRPQMFSSVCGLSSLMYATHYNMENDYTKSVDENNTIKLINSATEAQKEAFRNIRWYIDCGDDDFLYEGNVEFYVAMRKNNIPLQYRMREGTHDWPYWKEALPTILQFITTEFCNDAIK